MAEGNGGAAQRAQHAMMHPEPGLPDAQGSPCVSGLLQRTSSLASWTNGQRVVRYALVPLVVGAAFVLRQSLVDLLGSPLPPYITFYPAVMLVAVAAGRGPGLLATLLAALATDYWILEPVGHWKISASPDVVGLGLFSVMGVLMSMVAGLYRRIRDRLEELVAARTATLTQTNQQLQREMAQRVQVGESLRESEERLLVTVESLAEGVVVCDTDGNLLHFNRAGMLMHGFTSAEEYRRRMSEFTDDFALSMLDGTPLPVSQWPPSRILAGEILRDWEIRVRRLSQGWERIFRYSGSLVRDRDGRPRLAVLGIDDVTEQKQTEELQRRSQARQAFLLQLDDALRPLSDPVAIQTMATRILGESLGASRVHYSDVVGGTIVVRQCYCAPGVPSRVGRQALSDFTRDWIARVTADRTTIVSSVATDSSLKEQDKKTYEALGVRALMVVALVKKSRIVSLLSVHQSVPRVWAPEEIAMVQETAERTWAAVERAQAEAALHETAQRLEMALVGGRMGMWQWDFATNQVFWNPLEYELVGMSPGDGQVPVDLFFEHVHPEDRAVLQRNLAEVVETGTMWADEFRIVHDDGTVRWLAAAAQVLRQDAGRPVGMVGVNYDISDRKRAEEELKTAKDSAEDARAAAELANRAKDHFLAILSHELRTPLTPVILAVSMLQDGPDVPAATREMLEIIRRNTELETRLIDDLLDVTAIARGKIQLNRRLCELGNVIQQAVEVCWPEIESRRLHFGVDMGPAMPYCVEADAARLQQVFWNLIKNAIKFTPDGGCVGIRCRPDQDHVIVEVNDSGVGIEPDAMSRIFNAFEQAEQTLTRQFGGLGLGLTICKALVEMHGGTIEAQSEGRDRGATFRIRLPRVVAPAQPESAAGKPTGHRSDHELRILMVEDHAATAKMLRTFLTAEGHAVETASDVATALETATQHLFDLLISDLGLPDGNGHDLLRELRARGCDFPAIALSGFGQDDDLHRSQEAGFVLHLTKPASPEELLDAIAAVAVR